VCVCIWTFCVEPSTRLLKEIKKTVTQNTPGSNASNIITSSFQDMVWSSVSFSVK
jgi:hypothetical protein